MGLFFNYDKPGKGVDKNAPKKKGFFLYFELLWRKLGKLFQANMLYFLVSLPVILLYHFFFFVTIGGNLSESVGGTITHQLILMATVILTVLWGTGPVSAGYTFILRNFAREEHVWLTSDFFEKSKENFKYCLVFFLVDLVVLVLGLNAIVFYYNMAKGGNALFLYLMFISILCMLIYTSIHFYLYQFAVTFENKLGEIYKNALIMAIATMPMNLILTVFVGVCTYFVFSMLTPIAIVLLTFLCFISFMRFPIDFCSARVIKRRLIGDEQEETEEEE